MDYNEIKEKLKDFVLEELEIAQMEDSTVEDKLYARNRAYAALQFVNNVIFSYDKELGDWWNNEIRSKFLE